jgi:hypothetical protein
VSLVVGGRGQSALLGVFDELRTLFVWAPSAPFSMVGRAGSIVTAPCARRTYGAAMEVSPEDPWAAYARTVVEIRRPGEADIVVRPAPPGRSGAWPWASSLPVHILTAWDPGEERPGDQENRVQQAALEADLRHLTRDLWRAVGTDPVSGHREKGVAVRGVSDAVARVLGARYRQDAIFVWTPDAWVISACNGGRRVTLGWSVTPP